jgi:nicotinate-nucleotide adenylyltransferase
MPAPEPGQKWGILGGTFDPVHLGHLALATDILKARRLDGVFLIPAFDPPHRDEQPHASFEERLAMLKLVSSNEPRLEICTIEEELPRPSYTLETVRALGEKYVGVEFQFIVGADNLALLKSWHRWQALVDEIKLLVGYRPGANLDLISEYPPERIELVETSLIDISSTGIREAVRLGATADELSELVPASIAEHILSKGLYR